MLAFLIYLVFTQTSAFLRHGQFSSKKETREQQEGNITCDSDPTREGQPEFFFEVAWGTMKSEKQTLAVLGITLNSDDVMTAFQFWHLHGPPSQKDEPFAWPSLSLSSPHSSIPHHQTLTNPWQIMARRVVRGGDDPSSGGGVGRLALREESGTLKLILSVRWYKEGMFFSDD